MMLNWSDWLDDVGGAIGIRRKKSLTEKAVDAVQDFYETAVDAVSPVLTKPAKFASKASDAAFKATDRARESYESATDTVSPVLRRSSKMAEKAWDRTADTAEASLDAVSSAAAATAATGAAAAGAVGGFFGAIFSFVWWLVTFSLKTAILAGVAYAGWQWLQSRNNGDSYGGSFGSTGTGSTSHNSTYGSVSPAPATVTT